MEATTTITPQKKALIYRKELIADLPVNEHIIDAGNISTKYLEGGEGIPIVLLHGPGESAVWWMRVIPDLAKNFKIIVPDLPGHGSSELSPEKLNEQIIINWLDKFINKTCSEPPVLAGHVIGGAIAARYAIQHPNKVKKLALVDSLGLSSFRPAPRFALELLRFMMHPDEKSYLRFLPQCMYNINDLSKGMGKKWPHFIEYNIHSAQIPEKKAAVKRIMGIMSKKIPEEKLKQINIPVILIWGRYDKATKLKVANKASKIYGWPLYIIDDTRDDPKIEKPEEFVRIIESWINKSV